MSQEHTPNDDVHFLAPQSIAVSDFEADGHILDIGGGGEGVIGQLKGDQVVAIDRRKAELEEAPPGGLKIVMDATALQFLDDTFETVTAFYTLMYVRERADCAQLLAEVHRVLKPGGRFLIWDAVIPTRLNPDKPVVAVLLTIQLPDRTIETGYGTKWPDEDKNADYYGNLAGSAGFEVICRKTDGAQIYVELRKPMAAR